MEESLAPSPNSHLHLNRGKPMKNFQDFVFKLAHSHPNAALPPAAETLLRDRLRDFVSSYTTPDHPPYSAMIQNALQGLNEKGGSTKKSISRYLEERYDNLPFAHSLLLKNHLEATCESGEVVVSRAKKYSLAENPNLSTKAESKPQKNSKRKNIRKGRLESDRLKHYLLKLRSIKKGKKQGTAKKVGLIKNYKKHEEEEQPITENGEDQTKSLLSSVHSNSTILQNEEKHTEEVSTQQNNSPSEFANSEILEHQDKEDSEQIMKHQKLEEKEHYLTGNGKDQIESLLSCVDGEMSVHSNPTILQNEKIPEMERDPTEEVSTQQENKRSGIAKSYISENQEGGQCEHKQVEVLTPERPPGFEFVKDEKLYQSASTEPEPEPASAREVTVTFCPELVTPPKDGEFDFLESECDMVTPMNQGQVLDVIPITLKQMRHEKLFIEEDVVEVTVSVSNSAELMKNRRLGWRSNNKLKKSLLQNEHVSEPSLTSKELEFALSTEQKPREKRGMFQGKQVRRSLRAKPRVAEDANTEEHCPVTVCRSQDTLLKQIPTRPKRKELQDSPKSQKKRTIVKHKPDVKNLKAVDDFEQSVKRQFKRLQNQR